MAGENASRSDEELASQTQAGSVAAFEELVARYERRIYGFVVQSCACEMDAAEVTQNTFVRAFQAIAQYNSKRPFAGWLFAIARHKCIDYHRAKPPAAEASIPELTDSSNPAQHLAQQEACDNLWEFARNALPDTQFQALWLKYAEDMDVAQIAQVLRKTRTHVKVLLFRARKALNRELKRSTQSSGIASSNSSSPDPGELGLSFHGPKELA